MDTDKFHTCALQNMMAVDSSNSEKKKSSFVWCTVSHWTAWTGITTWLTQMSVQTHILLSLCTSSSERLWQIWKSSKAFLRYRVHNNGTDLRSVTFDLSTPKSNNLIIQSKWKNMPNLKEFSHGIPVVSCSQELEEWMGWTWSHSYLDLWTLTTKI